jgi:predicted PurR-regulated permease PerM
MKIQQTDNSIYETTLRLLILLFVIGWCLMIIYPFLNIMLWSLILSLALLPLHKMLTKKLNNKPKRASIIIIVSFLVIIILPSVLLMMRLIKEGQELKSLYKAGLLTLPLPNEKVKDWPIVGNQLYDIWVAASADLKHTIVQYKEQLVGVLKKVGQGIFGALGGVVQIMFSLIIAGILLAIGASVESIRKFYRKLIGKRGDEFADITLQTVSSVVKGILGVAIMLAMLHAIIFFIAGIPFAGILTLLIFVLCVLQIPAIIVTLPVIIYLFSEKEPMFATLWTVLLIVAGLSDNVLKPILLGKGAAVPMLVIFVGVIGGFILSGFIGLFTGAIVLSLGYKLFEGWMSSKEEPIEN